MLKREERDEMTHYPAAALTEPSTLLRSDLVRVPLGRDDNLDSPLVLLVLLIRRLGPGSVSGRVEVEWRLAYLRSVDRGARSLRRRCRVERERVRPGSRAVVAGRGRVLRRPREVRRRGPACPTVGGARRSCGVGAEIRARVTGDRKAGRGDGEKLKAASRWDRRQVVVVGVAAVIAVGV